MKKPIFHTLNLVGCLILSGPSVGTAAPVLDVTLFEDTFDADPAANGWTEFAPFSGDVSASGGVAKLDSGGFGPVSISRQMSTVGYENITLVFEAFQDGNDWETAPFPDIFQVTIDGNEVFSNVGVFTGVDGTSITGPGETTPTSSPTILLPASAANNPALEINVESFSTTTAEDYFLSRLRVGGDLLAAIPEASSFFLLGGLALGILHWQSRRRAHLRLV